MNKITRKKDLMIPEVTTGAIAGSATAGQGCGLYSTPPSFMGNVPDPSTVLGFPVGVDEEVTAAQANAYLQAAAPTTDRVRQFLLGQSVQARS